MKSSQYDVVVIGAGPAGSVTARYAAEKGIKVLLLERDREAGIPVRCAEGVSQNGIAPFIDIDPKWIATKIDSACLHSPDGEIAYMYNNGTGYVLERRIFDTELCNLAIQAGAEMLTKADAVGLEFEGTKITGVRYEHNGEIKIANCSIVIGADGVESRVGRWAGINTTLALNDIDTCVQYTVSGIDFKSDTCHFYFGRDVSPGGYIWIFPKSNKTANIGIGISGDLAADKGPKEYLDEFMEKQFPDASVNYTVYGGVPTAWGINEYIKDNIMLVGDSARQVNPITGGGIVQAMIAARIAGRVAADSIAAGDQSKKYLLRYKKEWDAKLGKIQKTMYSMKEKFMNMNDEKFNKLVKMCQGIPKDEFSLKKLFSVAMKGNPLLVAEIAKTFVMSKLK
ncbi:MAG: NAD(P)/FAD-dependent oxidoreductase [Candidatus Stygibacter australis]|nr:NAD(P)/FAD-dependent oxidoreductase [Candidatus Stygibacter australis]MDP8323237.1 NAD(P)/FAD-dependent oxidoreductase [Candidatus Stygibacter australis]